MLDAAPGGLVVELVAKGGVPQTTDDGVAIERVLVGAKLMRVLGDAAPGDVRTTRTGIDFEWKVTSTGPTVPIAHLFELAPPGMYSTLELRVGDDDETEAAFIMGGRVSRNGNVVPFEIKTLSADLPITVPITLTLPPRMQQTLTIQLDTPSLVEDVDWDAVPLTGEGNLFIGDGDAQMAKVTTELANAFKEFKR